MKKFLPLITILLIAMLALTACAPKEEAPAAEEPTTAEEPAAPAEEKFFVFLPKGLDNPYWDNCRKGMEAKMAELGVKAEFLGPEISNAAKQVEIFENVIARKPAAIAVSPNDPATVIAEIRAFREQHRLDGLTMRELIEEGRR